MVTTYCLVRIRRIAGQKFLSGRLVSAAVAEVISDGKKANGITYVINTTHLGDVTVWPVAGGVARIVIAKSTSKRN